MDRSELQKCEIPSNDKWVVTQNHILTITAEEARHVTGFDEGFKIWDLYFLQDMFHAVSTDEMYVIDVGWYPEGSPEGHYSLVLIERNPKENIYNWDKPLVEFDTRSLDQLLSKIRDLMSDEQKIGAGINGTL
ncbi:hypothetical protein [uncultured Gimesia sp.]|uniref:hypothetical protein n=1 Tax=uncultured Gimesia sp. TaxID=1678688 RepID=UPI0030D9A774|tara:strand:- start:67 stop:465 length:399 start_codon:yes stop_codon:yes gene_type:complete